MSKRTRADWAIKFAEGDPITVAREFTYRENYTDPLGSLTFDLAVPLLDREEYRDRIVKGGEVTLHIDGRQQARMLITTVEQELGRDGYLMRAECKSPLCTIYEASVDPFVAQSFGADTPMADAILSILAPFGFTTLVSDQSADITAISGKALSGGANPPALDELTHKDLATAQSDSAFGFCNRLLSRVGLVMRSDYDGKLLVGSPDYEQKARYVVAQDSDLSNKGDRMLMEPSIVVKDTIDRQFSETLIVGKDAAKRSKVTAGSPRGGVRVAGVTRPSDAPFVDDQLVDLADGRYLYAGPWKPRYKIDKKSRDKERCEAHATLLHCAQSVSAFTVRHAVDGFKSVSANAVWAVNTVGRVVATAFNIDEDMWLLERTMTGTKDKGQITMLTWIPKHALQLGGE